MFPQLHKSVVSTFYKKSFDLIMECVNKSEELYGQESSQATMSVAATGTSSVHSSSRPSASCS